MSLYWVRLKDGRRGTIETDASHYFNIPSGSSAEKIDEMRRERDAVIRAELEERAGKLGSEVDTYGQLPYPADPRLDVRTDCPSFCYSPNQCLGCGSCPKSYACSE